MEMAKRNLKQIIAGIWILAGVEILVGIFLTSNRISFVFGEILGSVVASLLMLHLYYSLDIELDLEQNKAIQHSRTMSILRSAIEIGVLMAAVFLWDYINPFAVLLGLFGRKFSPLFIPLWEKQKNKNADKAESK